MEWKGKVINKVDEKIKAFSNKASSKMHKSVQQNKTLNTFNDIHKQFVVIPINKANGNVAFICQWFYPLALTKELGLDLNNTGINKIYILVHKTNNQVISGHTKFLHTKIS